MEEVNTVERKVKVYCQYYPKPQCPKQHLNFIVRYEAVYLIKGTDIDEEGDLTFDMYDVKELDVCDDWLNSPSSMSKLCIDKYKFEFYWIVILIFHYGCFYDLSIPYAIVYML